MKEYDEIKSLELELIDPDVRENSARLNELISDDFEEFGSSGKFFRKQDILNRLPLSGVVHYELSNFTFRYLGEDYILVKYNSTVSGRSAFRSSIWVKQSGQWQMLHHQATVVPNASSLSLRVNQNMNQVTTESGLEIGLIGGPEKCDIIIYEYSGEWAAKFRLHKAIIANALGEIALRIEHIGSTSVPGLGAKPIIDILVVVPDSGDEDTYLSSLESAGYELRVREPEFDEHRMVRTPDKDVHVHVFSPNSKEIEKYLVFRNWLRQNVKDRARYESVKRSLAERDWNDMNKYAEAKSEVVESILSLAMSNQLDDQ